LFSLKSSVPRSARFTCRPLPFSATFNPAALPSPLRGLRIDDARRYGGALIRAHSSSPCRSPRLLRSRGEPCPEVLVHATFDVDIATAGGSSARREERRRTSRVVHSFQPQDGLLSVNGGNLKPPEPTPRVGSYSGQCCPRNDLLPPLERRHWLFSALLRPAHAPGAARTATGSRRANRKLTTRFPPTNPPQLPVHSDLLGGQQSGGKECLRIEP
jgi:hypothetical protein